LASNENYTEFDIKVKFLEEFERILNDTSKLRICAVFKQCMPMITATGKLPL
jgi:hypothetical protein